MARAAHSRRRTGVAVTSLSAAAVLGIVVVSGGVGARAGGNGQPLTPGVTSSTSGPTSLPTPWPQDGRAMYRRVVPNDPAPQPPKPSPPPPTPLTGAARATALEQEAVDAQAARLMTFVDAHDLAGLATTERLRRPTGLRVSWKNAVPVSLRDFAATLPPGVPVSFRSTAHSAADVDAASQALADAHRWYDYHSPKPWSVRQVTPTPDYSGLVVSVDRDRATYPDPDLTEVERALAGTVAMPIEVKDEPGGALTAGRYLTRLAGVHVTTITSGLRIHE